MKPSISHKCVCVQCHTSFLGRKERKYCSIRCSSGAKKGRVVTHGAAGHPLYGVWHNMMNRCYLKNHPRYKDWGGRGIKVCAAWRKDVWAFIVWAENNGHQQGLQLDRRDNNGNYTPKNCRFITSQEQAHNRRWRPMSWTEEGREKIRLANN